MVPLTITCSLVSEAERAMHLMVIGPSAGFQGFNLTPISPEIEYGAVDSPRVKESLTRKETSTALMVGSHVTVKPVSLNFMGQIRKLSISGIFGVLAPAG